MVNHGRTSPRDLSRVQSAAPYLAAVFLSLGILFWVTDLWRADFRVLFTYYDGGDLIWNAAGVKGLLENGTYLSNPSLGAPFGMQVYDFPAAEALHALLLWLLNYLTGNYAETINVLYVLSYPLTALAAIWVFRQFDIGVVPALICSLFYTFLYYHFFRGLRHFALDCYYLVPLLFWVVLTIGGPASGHPPALKQVLKSRWFLGRSAICIAMASYGFYYSFFGMFFLAGAGVFAWFAHRYRNGLLTAFILAGAMLFTSFCNVIPNFLFWSRAGKNHAALYRTPIMAEVYGLKITHLLLPSPGHRIPLFARLNLIYGNSAGVNEASGDALGIIGGLGFVFLIARALFRKREPPENPVFDLMAALNLMGLLLATIGGFGAIFSFLGFTEIRSYNRISIFLGFLAFLAVALLWRGVEKRVPARFRMAFIAASVLVGIFGLWDEIPAAVAPNYSLSAAQSRINGVFVATLESSVPAGSMIFQMPYLPFPEYGTMVDMDDYSHFRPYLHSKHLRWSYGTVKGRQGAAWMQAVSSRPVPKLVEAIAVAGYAGIYIDRFGYADRAAALESQLATLLKTTPIVSGDNRLCFFSLGSLARREPGQLLTSLP